MERRRFFVLAAGLLLAIVGVAGALAQTLLPNAEQTFTGPNGTPLAGGFVFTYVPGTTTPKMTWQDRFLSVPNSNPIVLDGNGQARIWGQGDYRQVVEDQFGSLVWDQLTRTPDAGLSNGKVVMYQVSPSFGCTVPFLIATPDGSVINTVGTQTSGLQEVLDQGVRAKGWSLEVNSAGGPVSASYGIQACVGIIYPPLRQQYITFNGTIVACTAGVGVCETFDSCFESKVSYNGSQHGGAPNPGTALTASVLFDARNPVPIEGITAIAGCEYDLGFVFSDVRSGISQATIHVSLVHGGVIGGVFRTQEINGAGPGGFALTHYGFLIDGAQALTAWEGVELDLTGDVHLWDAGGLVEGPALTNQSNYRGNKYYVGALKGNNSLTSNAIGIIGQNSIIEAPHITNEEGTYGQGIFLNTGAAHNEILANVTGPTVVEVLDDSGQPNNYTINGKKISQNYVGSQVVATPLGLKGFSAGAGATLDPGATPFTGALNVGGANDQTFIGLTFETVGVPHYVLNPKCFAAITQGGRELIGTLVSPTSMTWTAEDSTGAIVTMATGRKVTWLCQ